MTCIVGLVHDGVIYMGGDSAGISGVDVKIRIDPKVFIVDGRFIFGFTDSFRMGQLLRFSLKVGPHLPPITDYKFMCTTFIDAVRKCFKDGGYLGKDEDDGKREEGGNFLVGYNGVIYEVMSDFQVAINGDTYCSVGAGEDYAHGSLFSTANLRMNPRKRIITALRAATHFSGAVRPPFVIEQLPRSKKPSKKA